MVQGTLEKPGKLLSTDYTIGKKYAEKIRRGKLVIMWYSVDSVFICWQGLIIYPVTGFALADKGGLEWGRESAHSPLLVIKNKAAIRRLQGVD